MKSLIIILWLPLLSWGQSLSTGEKGARSWFVGGLVSKGASRPIGGVTVGRYREVGEVAGFLGLEAEWMNVPPTREENAFVYYYPFRVGAFVLVQGGPVVGGMGALFPGEVYTELGLHHKAGVFSSQLTWRASLANSPELNGLTLRVNVHFLQKD